MIPETLSKHLQSQIILLITLRGYFPFLDSSPKCTVRVTNYPGFSTVNPYIGNKNKILIVTWFTSNFKWIEHQIMKIFV